MRAIALALLAACSNAADPAPDVLPHYDGHESVTGDAPLAIDAPPAGPLHVLIVNEVVAAGDPDWFEVVNATFDPVELSDYIYVDKANDFTKAVAFPAMTLAPGAYYAQDVDTATSGFSLGSDEELWVYRKSDDVLSDGVDWADGDSPSGGSFARIPDIFGPFVTSTHPTKGAPNQP